MWIPCFIPLYSPLNLYLIILWILDFKYILLLLLLLLLLCSQIETKTKSIYTVGGLGLALEIQTVKAELLIY